MKTNSTLLMLVVSVTLYSSEPARAQVIGSDILMTRGNTGGTSPAVYRVSGANGSLVGPFTFGGSLASYYRSSYGPNGNLFAIDEFTGQIQEFNGSTGVFVRNVLGASPTLAPGVFTFGPNGTLFREEYMSLSQGPPQRIVQYNTTTGEIINTFVSSSVSGFNNGAATIKFGPDGNLWADDRSRFLRFDGTTGAPLGEFIAPGSGGLDLATDFLFRPNGNLLVSSANTDNVLEFDGTTGAFVGVFASGNGLTRPWGMAVGPDNLLYVISLNQNSIYRFNADTGAFTDVFATFPGLSPRPNYLTFTLTVIPEPSSLLLSCLVTGIAGAAIRRRTFQRRRV